MQAAIILEDTVMEVEQFNVQATCLKKTCSQMLIKFTQTLDLKVQIS